MLGYYKLHEAIREIQAAELNWKDFSRFNGGTASSGTIWYTTTQVHRYIDLNK
jgi:hypothetical protein